MRRSKVTLLLNVPLPEAYWQKQIRHFHLFLNLLLFLPVENPDINHLENLQMGAYKRNDKAAIQKDIDSVLSLLPQLKDRVKQKAGTLSTGEQQMLALGRALMLKPKLLLADEPSLGLSPNYLEMVFDKLVEINKNGTSILLVEQNASEALQIAHRGYVFNIGEIVLEDTGKNLARDEKVKKLFLGG